MSLRQSPLSLALKATAADAGPRAPHTVHRPQCIRCTVHPSSRRCTLCGTGGAALRHRHLRLRAARLRAHLLRLLVHRPGHRLAGLRARTPSHTRRSRPSALTARPRAPPDPPHRVCARQVVDHHSYDAVELRATRLVHRPRCADQCTPCTTHAAASPCARRRSSLTCWPTSRCAATSPATRSRNQSHARGAQLLPASCGAACPPSTERHRRSRRVPCAGRRSTPPSPPRRTPSWSSGPSACRSSTSCCSCSRARPSSRAAPTASRARSPCSTPSIAASALARPWARTRARPRPPPVMSEPVAIYVRPPLIDEHES